MNKNIKNYLLSEERLKQIVWFSVQHSSKLKEKQEHVYRGQIDEFIDIEVDGEEIDLSNKIIEENAKISSIDKFNDFSSTRELDKYLLGYKTAIENLKEKL